MPPWCHWVLNRSYLHGSLLLDSLSRLNMNDIIWQIFVKAWIMWSVLVLRICDLLLLSELAVPLIAFNRVDRLENNHPFRGIRGYYLVKTGQTLLLSKRNMKIKFVRTGQSWYICQYILRISWSLIIIYIWLTQAFWWLVWQGLTSISRKIALVICLDRRNNSHPLIGNRTCNLTHGSIKLINIIINYNI